MYNAILHSTDKELKTDLLTYSLTHSLTSIIFLLLSDKIQDCRKAMQDKDYKWGPVLDLKVASYLQSNSEETIFKFQ